MEGMTIPAPSGSQDTAAPQVTAPTSATTPPADKPAGAAPQANEPAGQAQETKTEDAASGDKDPSQEGEHKSWKEKRAERNRQRWQEYKATHGRIARLETEIRQLREAKAPDFSQITDPTEELAERTAWKVRQSQAGDIERQAQMQRQEAAEKLAAAVQEFQEEARSRIPDFDTVVNAQTPIHNRAVPMLVESEVGAEIAHHLGKPENRQFALDLWQKFETAPAEAFREFGRLEARLSRPQPKTVSTAPKPPATLSGGTNPLGFDPARSEISDMQAHLRKAGILR